ncbi:transglycosylase domain-containing protein [Nocardiopsis algeriensis]|uniref:Membrane peptidoglycan carboxypeptidase n=1 Tax=Nocardiopsis algeriensis TaxID=1478215 RepID=A0A841IPY4_9ACTN|nr:membrane peptidoglycan carboxypeptidase [Nocardiopsis algeriensis]
MNEPESGGDGEASPKAEAGEPEFISPITFKTSGSFFRERVAQALAEQGFGDGDEPADAEGKQPEAAETAREEGGDGDRTEALPAQEDTAAGTGGAAGSAATAVTETPEEKSSETAGEDASSAAGASAESEAAAETETMWPQARKLSEYVAEKERTTAVPAAGSTGPQGPAGTGPGGPKGPKGPGGGKAEKKGKRKKPLWWRITRVFLVVTGLFFILGAAAFAYFYTTVEVPDAAKADALEQGSTFYFADGETEFAYRGTDRDPISYEEMVAGGDHVVEAVISAEDRGFWTEPGVSVRGTTRAVWSTLSGNQVQGGSTITQQMVRNYYEGISTEQTITRKVREIIIALKVDKSESKEWVMEQYLNTIYFGRQAYGIQAASQAYYHKDVEEITPEEAAFLAAAIQQPTLFGQADVETTPAMEERWEYVVDGLVTTGAITRSEADQMEFPAPETERPQQGADLSGYRGYMYEAAVRELIDLGYTEDQINRQGFTIVTTFDKSMMDAAYEAVEGRMDPDILPEGVKVGLTTVDPATGEVLAFYGGHDYYENQYDSALLGGSQAGSAFKPYVLAAALEEGYSLYSFVDGSGPRYIQGSRIQNAGNAPGGPMNLIEATRVSNNLGYIDLSMEVGYENVRDTAYSMGLPEGSIKDDQLVPTMALGVSTVSTLDQASGYATFANGGEHVEAHVIKEIVNTEGENERPEVRRNQALSESTAADATYALQQVVTGGTGGNANIWTHPVAGKTGTTTGSIANWFVGYTPQLSTAVSVYNENNESFYIPGFGASGGDLAAPLWREYMTVAMEGYERKEFPQPAFAGSTHYWAPDPSTQEPEVPEEPVEEAPETPEVPVEPEVPEVPETPMEPELPRTPGIPEFPETTEPGTEEGAVGFGSGFATPGREEG